eukprot:g40863.t1
MPPYIRHHFKYWYLSTLNLRWHRDATLETFHCTARVLEWEQCEHGLCPGAGTRAESRSGSSANPGQVPEWKPGPSLGAGAVQSRAESGAGTRAESRRGNSVNTGRVPEWEHGP